MEETWKRMRYLTEKIKPVWDQVVQREGSFQTLYALLCYHYGHKARKYHTVVHLDRIFREYDRYLEDTEQEQSPVMVLGVTFHDFVYNPLSQTNEADSSVMMKSILYVFDVPSDFIQEVDQVIWVTGTYGWEVPPPIESLTDHQKLMNDLDLSGFGLPWEDFLENNKLVDQEFSVVPPEVYRPNRIAFLTRFSKCNPLFLTDYFRDKYEATAKENLSRYLEELTRT
jgi:predicted metal-dependent HD superfamily phosphohydrolase